MISVGDTVKDFRLMDQNGKEFTLSAHSGKKVLLSFHPMAWTSVCARQMQSLENNRESFEAKNTIAVGLSVDSSPCKKAWAKELKIEHTRLLSDFWPHGGLAADLGIFREKEGVSERANVLVDETGRIVFMKIYPIPELPDITEVLGAL